VILKPAKGICSTVLLILTSVLAVASIASAMSQEFTISTSFLTNTQTQTICPSTSYYTVNSTEFGVLCSMTGSVPLVSTITSTMTLATTLQIPFTQTYGNWIVAAAIVVLVIAVLFSALRKRGITNGPKQATLGQFVEATLLPISSATLRASEFCNNCGPKPPEFSIM